MTDILDHGFVRLVDSMGNDNSVVRAARVSYDAAWRAGEDEGSDTRLIRYLWKHAHSSPFEFVTFTFEVKAPIFVLRQWMRHRTFSFSELSARYRPISEEFYVPEPNVIGKQATQNKQGREECERDMLVPSIIDHACHSMFKVYQSLLAQDVPRELARMVLPLNTYSHMFATVNLLNLFRFLTLRCAPNAQYEIRQYANAIVGLIEPIAPVCVSAWRSSQEKA